MSSEMPFSFEEAYPDHKHWRGGPDELVNFEQELRTYKSGLEILAKTLAFGNFTKVITIGYSAANMMTDLLSVTDLQKQFPPYIKLTGDISWKLWSFKAVTIYEELGIDFDGGVLLEDFAETAKKAKDLNEYLLQPLKIPFSFAFLTATDTAVLTMKSVGLEPFVAIEHPTKKLMNLLDMRRSPGVTT